MSGLRGLTIHNPWMWSILQSAPSAPYGGRYGKPEENRGWPVPGGRLDELALHAGARSGWDEDGERSQLVQLAWQKFWGPATSLNRWMGTANVTLHRDNPLIKFSAITAVAEGVTCHHAEECMRLEWSEPPLSGCAPGWCVRDQYHWGWKALHVLAEPVPCRGYQKLWTVPEDAERAVRAQLEASR